MRWFQALLQEGYVLEIWKSDGPYACLASRGNSKRQVRGEGRNPRAAVEEAVKNLKEDCFDDAQEADQA